ncbi:unnamed protein product [Clavelina lepadiformis]|uniref:BHLH domain-containing protein n=1 Tax=Clavelina lepadiformis TaxID=159417 RepID=A0ABP0GYE3_CLALP
MNLNGSRYGEPNLPPPPEKNLLSVSRRNARERRRIKHVNSAFDDLRKRVETLRSAIEYIKALEALVEKPRKSGSCMNNENACQIPSSQVIAESWNQAVLNAGVNGNSISELVSSNTLAQTARCDLARHAATSCVDIPQKIEMHETEMQPTRSEHQIYTTTFSAVSNFI